MKKKNRLPMFLGVVVVLIVAVTAFLVILTRQNQSSTAKPTLSSTSQSKKKQVKKIVIPQKKLINLLAAMVENPEGVYGVQYYNDNQGENDFIFTNYGANGTNEWDSKDNSIETDWQNGLKQEPNNSVRFIVSDTAVKMQVPAYDTQSWEQIEWKDKTKISLTQLEQKYSQNAPKAASQVVISEAGNPSSDDNHSMNLQQIRSGNFSGIAGVWKNKEGTVYTITSNSITISDHGDDLSNSPLIYGQPIYPDGPQKYLFGMGAYISQGILYLPVDEFPIVFSPKGSYDERTKQNMSQDGIPNFMNATENGDDIAYRVK